jgi:hypothetical protein
VNDRDKESVRYWVDFAIKTGIMLLLGIASYHLKKIDDEIERVKTATDRHESSIQVLQSKEFAAYRWMERIDSKLDKIAEKIR